MKNLRKKATAVVTVCILACGVFYYVQAKNNQEVLNTEVENLVDPILKPIMTEEVYWLELYHTDSDDYGDQEFLTGIPMPNPPAESDNLDCAQEFNEGDYCGIALKFSQPIANLNGYATVQDVIDNHPDYVGIATDDPTIDKDEDGYSRMPL